MDGGVIIRTASNALLSYEAARQAIADCVLVDDAKDIKDRASALRHYALQKNDPQRAEWLGKIACRAAVRIGEISRVMEKAEYDKGHGTVIPINGKYKAETLAEAGLSKSAAQRFENLSRRPDIEQLTASYFKQCRDASRAPSVGGFLSYAKGDDKPKFSPFIKPTDNWNFSKVHYGRIEIEGEDGHGYIPGELYANCLWYWSKPGNVVVAPMAGSGQIARVYEDRETWMRPDAWDLDLRMFDLNPRGPYADRIAHNDLTLGLPVDRADYIVMDVPYLGIVEGQYSEKPEDLANMAREPWTEAIEAIGKTCASVQPEDGLCTVIATNYRETATGRIVLATELIRIAFDAAGYVLHDLAYAARRIQQDQSPQMAFLNANAKAARVMLTDMAEVMTFRRTP
jgi:hypothetical protein